MNSKKNEAIDELFKIRNPHVTKNGSVGALAKKVYAQGRRESLSASSKSLGLSKKAIFELTTARNRNLITIEEQNILKGSIVAFFGLSVGSHAALTWLMLSRSDKVKIADPDIISASNLNRLRFGWGSIGAYKTEVVKKMMLDIHPLVTVDTLRGGTQKERVNFLRSEPLAAIVDEIDDFETKIQLRKIAKSLKIPLVSAADVGDNVVIDIERYDSDNPPELFLGRIKNIEDIDVSKLTASQRKKMIIQLVGFEQNSSRMLDSLMQIGGTIPTWPQLGSTATITGGVISTVLKKILLGEHVNSGRYYLSLDELFVADYNSVEKNAVREEKIKDLRELIERN